MRSVSPLLALSLLTAACAPEGSSAYVSRNVPVDTSCDPTEDDIGIATGVYDVGASNSKANCVHSYFMNLMVNSNLKSNAMASTGRAEPNVLLITHADVRIMDKNQGTLSFLNSDGSADTYHPNPYRVQTASSLSPTTTDEPTSGIVEIEAIPRAYAEKLRSAFEDDTLDSVLLEVKVFGTTTGDVDIEFRPFLYPLAITNGGYSKCKSDYAGREAELTALTADECDDNVPQDGRYCIDPDC